MLVTVLLPGLGLRC